VCRGGGVVQWGQAWGGGGRARVVVEWGSVCGGTELQPSSLQRPARAEAVPEAERRQVPGCREVGSSAKCVLALGGSPAPARGYAETKCLKQVKKRQYSLCLLPCPCHGMRAFRVPDTMVWNKEGMEVGNNQ